MKVQEAYARWSASYDSDRNLTRDLDQAVTRQMLANVRCNSLLEIGCGTGKNTQLFSKIASEVHAVDFSAAMIARAKQKSPPQNVSFQIADITSRWPYKDGSFDVVACNLVLEHIEDLSFVFAEAARVLAKDGKFFVSELHPFRQYQGTRARFYDGDARTHIDAFVHHLTDFTKAAAAFSLVAMNEWWHQEDQGKPPRLVSFLFEKK